MGVGGSSRWRGPLNFRSRDDEDDAPRKILVLGCLGAGKSTLCKLLAKAANAPQPSIRLYKHTVENNLLEAFKAIFLLASSNGVNINSYKEDLNTLLNFRHREDLHNNAVEAMRRLGKSNVYAEVLKDDKTRMLDLPYNVLYWLQNSERILSKGYDPTEADLMACYAQTVGVNDMRVRLGYSKYELLELPGHHIFRRVWADFFENTNAIIFVIDLSDLCRAAFYNGGHLQNKVRAVLKSVVDHPAVTRAAFILLFNKRDLLEEMGVGYNFSPLASNVKTWEQAEKWYSEQCMHMVPPTFPLYSHSLSLTRKVDLQQTVVASLSQIFITNNNSFEQE